VINPATQEVVSRVPQSTPEELKRAEEGAKKAFKTWREVPVQQRQRVFFTLQQLIRDHTDELAHSITVEQGEYMSRVEMKLEQATDDVLNNVFDILSIGKTLADAKGDVFRGLEVVESACMMGSLTMGETQENLARGLDTYTYRQPLGVTAGICPFNFPAMIPLWMFPVASVVGNTMLLKPSEKDPGAASKYFKLSTSFVIVESWW
jgi:malonate-semialdehyde dehydrogenase (acetylating) / methylmalonate-semialdehyde dehydrogenase